MTPKRVARRYAEALLDSSQELKVVEGVSRDLEYLHDVIRTVRDFAVFLRSPVVKKEKKKEVLQELFARRVQALTLTFLYLLAEKGREETLPQIIEEYFQLRDSRDGIVRVSVRSARELSADQSARIEKEFAAYAKSNVRLYPSVDKSLLAGIVTRIGDTVFDGSVRRRLEMLREVFTHDEVPGGA